MFIVSWGFISIVLLCGERVLWTVWDPCSLLLQITETQHQSSNVELGVQVAVTTIFLKEHRDGQGEAHEWLFRIERSSKAYGQKHFGSPQTSYIESTEEKQKSEKRAPSFLATRKRAPFDNRQLQRTAKHLTLTMQSGPSINFTNLERCTVNCYVTTDS